MIKNEPHPSQVHICDYMAMFLTFTFYLSCAIFIYFKEYVRRYVYPTQCQNGVAFWGMASMAWLRVITGEVALKITPHYSTLLDIRFRPGVIVLCNINTAIPAKVSLKGDYL